MGKLSGCRMARYMPAFDAESLQQFKVSPVPAEFSYLSDSCLLPLLMPLAFQAIAAIHSALASLSPLADPALQAVAATLPVFTLCPPLTAPLFRPGPLFNQIVSLFSRIAALFGRIASLFNRIAALFGRIGTLFYRIVSLFSRIAALFSRIVSLFGRIAPLSERVELRHGHGYGEHDCVRSVDCGDCSVVLYGNL
jgi:hypothetical protein